MSIRLAPRAGDSTHPFGGLQYASVTSPFATVTTVFTKIIEVRSLPGEKIPTLHRLLVVADQSSQLNNA